MATHPETEASIAAPRDPSRIAAATRALLPLLPGAALLLFWEWASGRLIREMYVSRPSAVVVRLYELFATGEILPHLWITAQELVLGYAIGLVAGTVAGYGLGRSAALRRVFEPYIMAFYGIPKIALAPLFIIWFGIGIWSKVALAALMVFFLIFFNVYMGVRNVERELVDLARVMGANPRQLSRYVYLPATMPHIIMGMRMALPYSVIGVIVGEFTSSIKGLGLFINQASATYDPAGVFAGIAILLLFIVVMNHLAGRLERRVLRWRPRVEHGQGPL
jgi:NitT/TauT family transport system permease protein